MQKWFECVDGVGRDLDGFVVTTAVVGGSVGEEPVDDQADDGEDEDKKTPEELVAGGTARLEDLNCHAVSQRCQGPRAAGMTYSRR